LLGTGWDNIGIDGTPSDKSDSLLTGSKERRIFFALEYNNSVCRSLRWARNRSEHGPICLSLNCLHVPHVNIAKETIKVGSVCRDFDGLMQFPITDRDGSNSNSYTDKSISLFSPLQTRKLACGKFHVD